MDGTTRAQISHTKMDTPLGRPPRHAAVAVILLLATSSCSRACNNAHEHSTTSSINSFTASSSTLKPNITESVVKQTSVVIAAACADALCSASNIVTQFSAPEVTNTSRLLAAATGKTVTSSPGSVTTRKFNNILSKRRRSRIRTSGSPNSLPASRDDDEPMESQSFLSPVIVNLPQSDPSGARFETQMAGNGLIPPPPYLLKRTRSIPATGRSVSHSRRAILRPPQSRPPMRTQGVEVPIPSEHKSQFNVLNAKEGTYRFGYDTGTSGEQSYRYERRQPDGKVVGKYGFLDPAGVLREVNYVADDQGFRPVLVNRYRVDMDYPSVIGPIPSRLKFT